MKRYQHPAVIEHLASSYVAGTLQPAARRRMEVLMRRHAALALEVDAWSERLTPLFERLPEAPPSQQLWAAIEQRTIGPAPAKAPVAQAAPSGGTRPAASPSATPAPKPKGWRAWVAPWPVAHWVLGLALGLAIMPAWQHLSRPAQEAQLPASYAGVLGTADGKPGLVVSSLRHAHKVDVRQLTPVPVPAGQTLYLWRIDAAGQATAIGALSAEKWSQVPLAESAEKVFFTAVELAVSLEPVNTQPTAPSTPYVYRGLCGKVWKP